MHRKLGWYLVELENELRNSKTEAERAELLKEVEAHVREHAEDLREKGMDEHHAIDSALVAFGPPSEVARGSWKAPKWLIAIICVGLILLSYLLISNVVVRANDIIADRWALPSFSFGYLGVAFALVAILVLVTRKLVAPFVALGALALTALCCIFVASQYSFFNFNGNRYLVGNGLTESMIEDRQAWVAEYSAYIEKMGDPKTQEAQLILTENQLDSDSYGYSPGAMESDQKFYKYPSDMREDVRSYLYNSSGPRAQHRLAPIIMPTSGRIVRHNREFTTDINELVQPGAEMPYLSTTVDQQKAVAAWRTQGSYYLAGLRARIRLLEENIKDLGNPVQSSFSERFFAVAPIPFAVVGIMCLLAVAMNFVLLWPIAVRDNIKRKAWRRRFV